MESLQSRFIKRLMRRNLRTLDALNIRVWDENTSVPVWRDYCEAGAAKAPMPKGLEVVPVKIPGLPAHLSAEWLQPAAPREEAVIFYTHGGGYISGSCSDHRALVAKLALSTGLKLLLFEYRLAPEYPYPAALEDTLTSYRWMLTQIQPSTKILIAGESAGGGLCLAALLALKDLAAQGEGLRLPAAGVAISPLTDLAMTGKPNGIKGSVEPENMNAWCCKYYVGSGDPTHPYISPLYGSLQGLPPLFITVGTDEGLLDDGLRFAEKAKAAGVEVRLIVGEGQTHCYPLMPDFIPEAKYAMREIRAFVQKHTAS
ncbi:hypothetical protein ADN01_00495 [Levilinea saccharolytica]|uniref:Alpha/beta hydrolase fold-3 domain-containing protein n=2 Tax=Levilinea saccharolytica TaxID=229921 RepID=A0A0P6Z354_9CHLR|nr:hypothetical protein ADN01_00495 [Levilinea saccharolytica]GAP17608.1 esterase [Levilinea saccharolytica]